MADTFNLDVTQGTGETVTITTPTGQHVYDVLPLTKSRMIEFSAFDKRGRELKQKHDAGEATDLGDAATSLIDAICGLLGTQNGGPPARALLVELWDDDYLGFGHLERLTRHLAEKAGGSPPA